MDKAYSLNLPKWGPYNKRYLGASHVCDKEKGLRFDVNLFPGCFRRSVMSVKDIADSGVKMMSASPKLTKFTYRYEIQWKDKIYVDAHFSSKGNVLKVECDFVNNTDLPESLSMNVLMSMHGSTLYHKEILSFYADAKDGIWIDGADYEKISTTVEYASDGLYLCECRKSGFVGGSYVDLRKAKWLLYKFAPVLCDKIRIRYRGSGDILIKLCDRELKVCLPQKEEAGIYDVEIEKGEYSSLEIFPLNCSVDFDGFLMGNDVLFESCEKYFVPQCQVNDNSLKISYEDKEYTLYTDCDDFVVRRIKTDDAERVLSENIHNHVDMCLGDGGREYIDLFIRPVFVNAHSRKTVTITISAEKCAECEKEEPEIKPYINSYGKKYMLSQEIMSAVTLTNVVWPVYSRRGYILHNTPGRNWDSLYTWDSGFIGMGLAQLDTERATECLNAYLTPQGDIHSPYIMHGTPMPTQIFLFGEIFNKTGNIEFLKKFYPLVKQQYTFFSDRGKKRGMFALWDVFYNSGGWDDYPPQKYVHENHLEEEVCPVCIVANVVLCAKILKNLGEIIGEDTALFDEDIKFYSQTLNECAWDEKSGYYGYVKADGGILKTDGVNANMGMDGAYPFVAGVSDREKSEKILKNIKEGMVTPIGVSVVDTRAPYFKKDGYWNGSVWMPHQWILWKGCLDRGESTFAREIAEKALALWERETSYTYNCYEHFMIENGRGAGFHQFSGLSTPVLMWFSAYYKPYTVTGGFMTLIWNREISDDKFTFNVKATGDKPVLLLCMPEGKEYKIKSSGRVSFMQGVYEVEFEGPINEKIEIISI